MGRPAGAPEGRSHRYGRRAPPAGAVTSKVLRAVAANDAVSYGNYFRFDSGSAYNITAEIKRPNVPGTAEAKFEYRAP